MSKKKTEDVVWPDAAIIEAVRADLVAWFEGNGRDLPWRRTRDPWCVLVSEVMLQQIQVRRAVPFYLSFLERFPTVGALAAAPLSEAIKVWGDLGRYRRVVNLHRTARIVVGEHAGRIPSDPKELVKLPGIGPYTAGAVACFAFEERATFLDTNMRRVLHRLFFGPEVPEKGASEREVLSVAAALVPEGQDSWKWNQAIMELGALVCKARKPGCESCPVADVCRAREEIGAALAGVPRRPKAEAARRYEDSNRFLRGRVLAQLREAPDEGLTLRELGASLREGEDAAWILPAVRSLEKDGLATTHEPDRTRPAAVVAETRPAYGPERLANGETAGRAGGDLRIKLP